jgi:hypothetical protein
MDRGRHIYASTVGVRNSSVIYGALIVLYLKGGHKIEENMKI